MSVRAILRSSVSMIGRYSIPTDGTMRNCRMRVHTLRKSLKKAYHTRNIDTQKTLNMEQVLTLIEASRETPIHMQVLFAVLLGLR